MGRNYCKKELSKLNIKCRGSYGNYLLIDLKDRHTKSSICKNLKKNKIYIKNFNDKILENFILITVGPVRINIAPTTKDNSQGNPKI